ncbi:MAG: tyrosine-protein kinase family protein [Desulfobacteraceae bacterium]|nr:MAG: tyrosine-protein kinase family protein [Desulfobacteraceae bacterium]
MGKTHQALQRAEQEYQERIITSRSGPDINVRHMLPKKPSMPRQTTNDQYLAQYEFLKSNLLSRYPSNKLTSLAFTSASLGDGTTTTAVNFATAMAKDSLRSVLLVDANFRHPCLHDMFHIELTNGLSDFLARENGMEPQFTMIEKNLHIQTAGSLGLRAAGLFESPQFDRFIETACSRFDHVILDCPPVAAFSETRVIAGKVGGVIMVVNAGKTRQKVALRTKNDLIEAGAEILGTVLNRRKFHIPYWVYKRL